MKTWINKNGLHLVLAMSLAGMISSLFFSEVLKFTPCVLCWWQRIFLYPIAIISFIATMKKDLGVIKYLQPLSFIGLLIALYHNFLVWGIIPEKAAPCVNGISCIEQPFALLGFVTIPFLSLIAFGIIYIICLINKKHASRT